MKNQTLIVITTVLVIVLGIQAYMTFQLHKRLNHFSGQHPSGSFEITLPDMSKTLWPKADKDDGPSKGDSWHPYEEMQNTQNKMGRIFNKSLSHLGKTPEMNLQEKPDNYVVTVNTPGADESSLAVKLEGQTLHIAIKTEHAKDESDEKQGKYQYRERFVGEFQRVLTLPGPADATKMTTEYRNGVLTVTVPKA